MKKYIRYVVLVCALNGVGVWAEAPCARKINSPEFGPWPAYDHRESDNAVCERYRDSQSCIGRDGAVGWTGYYCNNGPQRHHREVTFIPLFKIFGNGALSLPCPHASQTVVNLLDRPTKVLSKDPCSDYNPGWSGWW